MRIVECVPNISNGVNPDVYEAVAAASEKINGVKLLDIDPGVATNRTVITFAGPPECIVDAAFEVIKKSKELIDMSSHQGAHSRMGATDVCPFVPVSGVTIEECAELAKQLAKRVGEELGVWVYLYEEAARKPEWKSLSNIRQGEYESLKSREHDIDWKADFGPEKLDQNFGAVAIGARKFLVAYNINVNSNNLKMAKDIAFNIRETGRAKRDFYPDGKIIKNSNGLNEKIPGIFSNCKSTAWLIPEYNRAQITMNLTDIDKTPVHKVFDEVEKQAFSRGMRITGSEIVGLVPLKTMLDAGNHYLKKQGLSIGVSEEEVVRSAMLSLGLDDVSDFVPEDKIIEYKLREEGSLVNMTVTQFSNTLASNEPAPGGGSVAALCGNIAASLASMVSNLTHGKIDYKESWDEMERVGVEGQKWKDWFLKAVDRDTDSFNDVMNAMRLPKKSDEQKLIRDQAIEKANQICTSVPLEVLENTLKVVPLLEILALRGNPNCISDIGVGVHSLKTCAEGAALNVRINLNGITDESFKRECQLKVEKALSEINDESVKVLNIVEDVLKSLTK